MTLKLTRWPRFDDLALARRGHAVLPRLEAAKVRARLKERFARQAQYWRGVADASEADLAEKIRAAAACFEEQRVDDDLELMAVAERMTPHGWGREEECSWLRLVAEARGVPSAIAMKLESVGLELQGRALRRGTSVTAYAEGSWALARALVCAADEPTYAEARATAAKIRAAREGPGRVAADFIFPSEPAWAHEDLDASLAAPAFDRLAYAYASLLASIADEARALAFLERGPPQIHGTVMSRACDLACGLAPEAALRVFEACLARPQRQMPKAQLATLGVALAALEGPAAAEILAGMLLHAPIGPVAVEYFKRFPDLARAALPKVAAGSSKAAEAARAILAAATPKEEGPIAAGDEIPAILRAPPWRTKTRAKPVVLSLETPAYEERLEWRDGERARVLAETETYAPMDDETRAWYASLPSERRSIYLVYRQGVATFMRAPPDEGLVRWNADPKAPMLGDVLSFLAEHGEAALPGLFAREPVPWSQDELLDAILHVDSPRAAIVAASAYARRKAWRKKALEWLLAHPRAAALGLLPRAFGPEGKARKEAEQALNAMRAVEGAILEASRALGAEDAARALFARDPLADLAVKGKLPPFVRVGELPPPRTKRGERLPEAATIALLEMLRSSDVDPPYPGIALAKEALDPQSLAELAWALTSAWILAGARGTFAWIPMTLAHLGDDGCARKLAPYVREWARKDAKKTMLAADVLAAMGSDAALLHLAHVADKSRFELARAHANEALEACARARGLTAFELADRTVPDLDLSRDGTATLDFGSRAVTVTFDETLQPVLLDDAGGARLPQLPRGTKSDDATKVKAAQARFKALKTDAAEVAASLLRRFESAMVRGRAFRGDDFRAHVLGHPLVVHLARRLVWSDGRATFRVAEDGTFASAVDAAYTLPEDAVVTLPHPLALGPDVLNAWIGVFADYAIAQPFEQLGRATFTLADDELRGTTLARAAGRTSRAGPLLGSLDARGWGKSGDTHLDAYTKVVRTRAGGEARATLAFGPGIDLADVAGSPEQKLGVVNLHGAAAWSDVDPVDVSELVRDLIRI